MKEEKITTWACITCEEMGEGEDFAEKHFEETQHEVIETQTRIRYFKHGKTLVELFKEGKLGNSKGEINLD